MKQRIEEKLREKLRPSFLEVKNNSAQHQGHLIDDSGETHFAIIIAAQDLQKLNRISAHRKVNEVIKDEFEKGLHALEIKVI